MANIFMNENNESVGLGIISFNFLNERDVFDDANEDDDYYSEVIFKCTSKEKLNELADKVDSVKSDIIQVVGMKKKLRR